MGTRQAGALVSRRRQVRWERNGVGMSLWAALSSSPPVDSASASSETVSEHRPMLIVSPPSAEAVRRAESDGGTRLSVAAAERARIKMPVSQPPVVFTRVGHPLPSTSAPPADRRSRGPSDAVFVSVRTPQVPGSGSADERHGSEQGRCR